MKVSTSTGAIGKYGWEKAFQIIKNAGFDAIDYGYFERQSEVLGDDYLEVAKKQRAMLDALSLECGQSHAPFDLRYEDFIGHVDALEESLHYRWIVRSMEASVILGSPVIVIHSLGVPEGVDEFKLNVDFYRSLIPYAERYGIKIAIENLFYAPRGERYFRGRLADAEELLAMLRELDSPVFTICIDVGHSLITGRVPENILRQLGGEHVTCLHLHDNNTWDDQHRIPYFGAINWDEVCAALREIGYKGNFNGEISYGNGDEETMQDAYCFSGKVLKRLAAKVDG